MTIPAAIASPWRHLPYPVPASMAWPKVRGRPLQQGNAGLVNRGGKPGQIADHPAAERDDERIAAAACCQQRVEHALEARPALRLLAIVEHDLDHARVCRLERLLHARQIKRRHDLVGHHGRAAGWKMRRVQRRRIEDAGADVNRIGALAGRYAEAFHCSSSLSSRSRASARTLWVPVSTTRSATPR